jgi:hypothetical protein
MNITDIVGGVFKPVADFFNRRQELKSADHQAELKIKDAMVERQVSLIKDGLAADMSWEMEFARQAGSSWKDEYTLLVVSVPLILAFIPGGAPFVVAGFNAFATTPMWYQVMVQTIFYATYGIRLWRRNQSDT